jgi:hypothetical protein
MPSKTKFFKLTSVNSKSFNLIVEAFDFAITLLFRIINHINITFVSSAIVSSFSTITLKKIKLVSATKLIGKIVSTINLKRIRLNIVAREIGKIIAIINIRNRIGFVSKAVQKSISTIILKKIKFTFTAILATFFTLGTYDPSTLATMDTETLGDLDYIVS